MKSKNEILTAVMKEAQAFLTIGGNVYKQTRPTGSTSEDCVVSLMAEAAGKFVQNGRLYVKIFYPNLYVGNTWYENMPRGQQLEQQLENFSNHLAQKSIVHMNTQSRRIRTVPMPPDTTQEHYALLQIDYEF
jgi:hypothetical protein